MKLFPRRKYALLCSAQGFQSTHKYIHICSIDWTISELNIQRFEINFDAKYEIRHRIPFALQTGEKQEKIATANSVDEEKLLRANWEWSEAQRGAKPCKML